MCYIPKYIINPSQRYLSGVTKQYLSVPCGICESCRKLEQEQWYLRLYEEFKYTQSIGGTVWFPTLTYNNYYKPVLKEDYLPFDIDCFERKHIQYFIKKLRIYLKNSGYDSKQVKYMVCSEYGSDPRYTQRPHYHVLLFFPFKIDGRTLMQLLRKCWQYGFVSYSKKFNGEVLTPSAIRYVSKYISKDLGYFKKYEVSQIKEYVFNHVEKIDFDDVWKEVKSHFPFHLQSYNLGISLLGKLTLDDFLRGYVDINQVDLFRLKPVRIPRYFYNRKFYTYIDGKRVLRDGALEYFDKRFDGLIKESAEIYKKLLNPSTYDVYHDLYFKNLGFSKSEFKNMLSDLTFTPTQFALFIHCFDKVTYTDDTIFNYDILQNMYIIGKDIYFDDKFNITDPTVTYEFKHSDNFTKEKTQSYDKLPIFRDFVFVKLRIEKFFQEYNKVLAKLNREREKQKKHAITYNNIINYQHI